MSYLLLLLIFLVYYLSISAGKIAEYNDDGAQLELPPESGGYKIIPVVYSVPCEKILSLSALVQDPFSQAIPVMNRLTYALYAVFAYAPFYALLSNLETLTTLEIIKKLRIENNIFVVGTIGILAGSSLIVSLLFGATMSLRCARRRFHDIGLDNFNFFARLILFLSCVPIVNIISIFLLSLLPGKTAHFRNYRNKIAKWNGSSWSIVSVLAIPQRIYDEYNDCGGITLPHKGLLVKLLPWSIAGVIGRFYYIIFGSAYFYVLYTYLPDVSHLTTWTFRNADGEIYIFLGLWVLSLLYGNLVSRRLCDLQVRPNEKLIALTICFIPFAGLAYHYFYLSLKPGFCWNLRHERKHYSLASYVIESFWRRENMSVTDALIEYGYLKPKFEIVEAEIIPPEVIVRTKLALPCARN